MDIPSVSALWYDIACALVTIGGIILTATGASDIDPWQVALGSGLMGIGLIATAFSSTTQFFLYAYLPLFFFIGAIALLVSFVAMIKAINKKDD